MNLKKILALVLVLAMLVSMVPTYAFAEDVELWDEEEVAVQDDAALEDVYLDEEPEEVIVEDEPEGTELDELIAEEPAAAEESADVEAPTAEAPAAENAELSVGETADFEALTVADKYDDNGNIVDQYATVQEAVNAGGKIAISSNYKDAAPEDIIVTTNTTLTTNGHTLGTITVKADATFTMIGGTAKSIKTEGNTTLNDVTLTAEQNTLNVTGGTIAIPAGDTGSYGVASSSGSPTGKISGGTFSFIPVGLIAPGYEKNSSGAIVKKNADAVAMIGTQDFTSLSGDAGAFAYAKANSGSTIILLGNANLDFDQTGTFAIDPNGFTATVAPASGFCVISSSSTASGITTYVIGTGVCKIGTNNYRNLKDAFDHVEDGQTIELTDNYTLTADDGTDSKLIVNLGTKSVTLDLGGFTLTGRTNITSGYLTVQNGTISNADGQALNVYGSPDDVANYVSLTVAENVTINAGYAVCLFGATATGIPSYGATINFNGTATQCTKGAIFVSGNVGNEEPTGTEIAASANIDTINIGASAKISSTDQALAMNGMAKVTIAEGAELTGREAIGLKRGILVVNGGTFTATGAKADPVVANNNGTEVSGAALSISSTYNYAGTISATINGGTFRSANNAAVYLVHSEKSGTVNKYEKGATISITDGDFISPADVSPVYVAEKLEDEKEMPSKFIAPAAGSTLTFSGNFNEDYCADTFVPVKNVDDEGNVTYTVEHETYAMRVISKADYMAANTEDAKRAVIKAGQGYTAEQAQIAVDDAIASGNFLYVYENESSVNVKLAPKAGKTRLSFILASDEAVLAVEADTGAYMSESTPAGQPGSGTYAKYYDFFAEKAMIGEQYYHTFALAAAAATKNDTIKLLASPTDLEKVELTSESKVKSLKVDFNVEKSGATAPEAGVYAGGIVTSGEASSYIKASVKDDIWTLALTNYPIFVNTGVVVEETDDTQYFTTLDEALSHYNFASNYIGLKANLKYTMTNETPKLRIISNGKTVNITTKVDGKAVLVSKDDNKPDVANIYSLETAVAKVGTTLYASFAKAAENAGTNPVELQVDAKNVPNNDRYTLTAVGNSLTVKLHETYASAYLCEKNTDVIALVNAEVENNPAVAVAISVETAESENSSDTETLYDCTVTYTAVEAEAYFQGKYYPTVQAASEAGHKLANGADIFVVKENVSYVLGSARGDDGKLLKGAEKLVIYDHDGLTSLGITHYEANVTPYEGYELNTTPNTTDKSKAYSLSQYVYEVDSTPYTTAEQALEAAGSTKTIKLLAVPADEDLPVELTADLPSVTVDFNTEVTNIPAPETTADGEVYIGYATSTDLAYYVKATTEEGTNTTTFERIQYPVYVRRSGYDNEYYTSVAAVMSATNVQKTNAPYNPGLQYIVLVQAQAYELKEGEHLLVDETDAALTATTTVADKAVGRVLHANTEHAYDYTVVSARAEAGENLYANLADAVAAGETDVTMLADLNDTDKVEFEEIGDTVTVRLHETFANDYACENDENVKALVSANVVDDDGNAVPAAISKTFAQGNADTTDSTKYAYSVTYTVVEPVAQVNITTGTAPNTTITANYFDTIQHASEFAIANSVGSGNKAVPSTVIVLDASTAYTLGSARNATTGVADPTEKLIVSQEQQGKNLVVNPTDGYTIVKDQNDNDNILNITYTQNAIVATVEGKTFTNIDEAVKAAAGEKEIVLNVALTKAPVLDLDETTAGVFSSIKVSPYSMVGDYAPKGTANKTYIVMDPVKPEDDDTVTFTMKNLVASVTYTVNHKNYTENFDSFKDAAAFAFEKAEADNNGVKNATVKLYQKIEAGDEYIMNANETLTVNVDKAAYGTNPWFTAAYGKTIVKAPDNAVVSPTITAQTAVVAGKGTYTCVAAVAYTTDATGAKTYYTSFSSALATATKSTKYVITIVKDGTYEVPASYVDKAFKYELNDGVDAAVVSPSEKNADKNITNFKTAQYELVEDKTDGTWTLKRAVAAIDNGTDTTITNPDFSEDNKHTYSWKFYADSNEAIRDAANTKTVIMLTAWTDTHVMAPNETVIVNIKECGGFPVTYIHEQDAYKDSYYSTQKNETVDGDTVVTIKSVPLVTISFNVGEHAASGTAPAAIKVRNGYSINDEHNDTNFPRASVVLPTVSAASGYSFAGWYDGDTKVEDTTKFTESKSLTAHWDLATFTYTFHYKDANGEDATKTVTGAYNDDVTDDLNKAYTDIKNIEVKGLTIKTANDNIIWYEGATTNKQKEVPATITQSMDFYARYDTTKRDVTLLFVDPARMDDGDAGLGAELGTLNVKVGTKLAWADLEPYFTVAGYKLTGWATDHKTNPKIVVDNIGSRPKTFTVPDEDVSLYAIATVQTYTVKYQYYAPNATATADPTLIASFTGLHYGDEMPAYDAEGATGGTKTLPEATTIRGRTYFYDDDDLWGVWNTEEWSFTDDEYADVVSGDVTYTLKWAQAYNVTVVSDNLERGKVSVVSGKTLADYEDELLKLVPEKEGFTFMGWDYDETLAIQGNITINAQWEKESETITVTWLNDDGSTFKTTNVKRQENITAPTEDPTKDNTSLTTYVFSGWTDLDGNDVDFASTTNPIKATKDVSYKAKFASKPINNDTISYTQSIALEDAISIFLYIRDIPEDAVLEDYMVKYTNTKTGESNTVNLTSKKENKINVGNFAVKAIADEVDVVVSYKGAAIREMTLSVKKYCDYNISRADANGALRNLCDALLDFGTYAWTHFSYDGAKPKQTPTPVDSDAYQVEERAISKTGTVTGISGQSLSLALEYKTEMYFYLKHEADVQLSDYTFSVTNADKEAVDFEAVTNGSSWFIIKVDGIAAKNLDDELTLNITHKDGTAMTLKAAPTVYMYLTQDNASLGDVSRAMYQYYLKARAYFTQA